MDKKFDSSKFSVRRGKHHAANFETGVNAFIASEPYDLVTEIDPDTGDQVEKVKLVEGVSYFVKMVIESQMR